MDIPENIIKEIVESINNGEVDSNKLSALSKYVISSAPVGEVDPEFKAKALIENIRTAVQTKEFGGVHLFLSRSLNDEVFVLGTSNKGFSRSVLGKDSIAPGKNIIGKMIASFAEKLNDKAIKYERYTATNKLDNWSRMIKTSIIFVDKADLTATQLAKTPSAKDLGFDATSIFKDAVRIEPKTELGKITREEAQRELLAKNVA
ncbi:MAG: hypothetical protein KGI41_00780 [Patescibacteria group bacterium]|nr:hypothetical protein [Patescibacteria group bacterium]